MLTDARFLKEALRHKWHDGSTALVVALQRNHQAVVVANAGDSRS
jgi:serine/threonine protein phosphatase PrpC